VSLPARPSERDVSAAGPTQVDSSGPPGPLRRFLLPSAVSRRHALAVLILGFVVEGGTEAYQFLQRGNLSQGWPEYYTSLGTTILGFYLMFLGLREWKSFQPKRAPGEMGQPRKGWPWLGIGLWAAGTVATAILDLGLGGGGAGSAPPWIAWPVGGLIVLAFGSFFFRLRSLAMTIGPRSGTAVGWVAFAWSLAVATVAGLAVGDRAILFLTEFVTNWANLVASVAPVVVAMSPLVVTYGLLAAAYGLAHEKLLS
jgi:hypothetical protein